MQKSLDLHIDDLQKNWGLLRNKIIVDSRLGYNFIPQSFRVSVVCEINEAALRGHKARPNQPNYSTPEIAKNTIKQRVDDELKNYNEKHGIPDYRSHFHFDLVVDNTNATPEQTAEQILDGYKNYLEKTSEMIIIARSFDTIDAHEFDYTSMPVSEGPLMYAFLREKELPFDEKIKKHPEYVDKVIKQNIQNAKKFAEKIKSKYRTPVIIPANFYHPEWTERDYLNLWIPVLDQKATRVHFINGWHYANGCIREYIRAKELKKPCYDEEGNEITKEKALSLIDSAINELKTINVSHQKLEELRSNVRRM